MKTTLKKLLNDNTPATTFKNDTVFDGNLSFNKTVKIEGKFKGKINSDGTLIIGRDADVEANIKASSVILEGTIKGNIEAMDKLEILPTGKLYGNIKTSKLKIADGVVFEGSCEMIKV